MDSLIIFYEHQFKEFEKFEKFKKKDIEELFKAINKQSPLDEIENDNKEKEFDNLFRIYPNGIKAKHYVGFTVVNNKIIQVLPKVFAPANNQNEKVPQDEQINPTLAFIKMLNFAYDLKIKDQEFAEIKNVVSIPVIYEIFVYFFASALLSEIKKGFYKEYVKIKKEEKFLKGKLLIDKQIKKLPHQRHIFSIEYYKFTENNLLNQIFFYTAYVSLKNTKWITNKKLLRNLMLIFEGVALRKITIYDFKKVHFIRLNERFKKPFNLAKIILSSFGEIEGEEAFGFFVDMNDLFEKFICSVLKKSLGLEVKFQESFKLFSNTKKIQDPEQKPDYVVYKNDKPIFILDAKYTKIEKKEGKICLPSGMLRQVYTYAKIIQYNRKLDKIDAILIFPKFQNYNKNIKIENATFFDNKVELHVLTYDLTTLIEGDSIDENFIKELREIKFSN